MTDSNNLLDHIDNIQELSLKSCARLGCINKPDKVLLIELVDKQGHFCSGCSRDLLQMDLAKEISINGGNKVC